MDNKKIAIVSIFIGIILIMFSLTSVVGYYMVQSSESKLNSPLFNVRIGRLVGNNQKSLMKSTYLGKGDFIQLFLSRQDILSMDILTKLSEKNLHDYFESMDEDIVQKWEYLIEIAKLNFPVIDNFIKNDYSEFKSLVEKYADIDKDTLKNIFIDQISLIDKENLENTNTQLYKQKANSQVNITSGTICNITTGPICSITTQPVCSITTQPICLLLTLNPICLTMLGPLCPTTGFKCYTPTTKLICNVLLNLGPILKALVLILIIGIILLIPAFIVLTVANPDACSNIKDQITSMFNCSVNETGFN